MSDTDNTYLDPRGDTPTGSAWPIGNLSANDPLVDWASNLKQDDLARFLHDPQGTSQDLANRGVEPPNDAAIQQMHDHNDAMGTPSRSSRFLTSPQGPTGLSPQQEATRGINEQRQVQGQRLGFAGTDAGDPDSPWNKDLGKPSPAPDPNSPIANFNRWRNPNDPNNIPAPQPPVVVKPQPAPAPIPAPAQTTAPPVATPAPAQTNVPVPRDRPAGADLDSSDDSGTGAQAAGDKTPSQRKKVEDALSTIGKAMQGVKAPEPLKPPSGFAPAPRGPTAAGAPTLAGLLGLTSAQGGQVPASAMPLLRLLGR